MLDLVADILNIRMNLTARFEPSFPEVSQIRPDMSQIRPHSGANMAHQFFGHNYFSIIVSTKFFCQ